MAWLSEGITRPGSPSTPLARSGQQVRLHWHRRRATARLFAAEGALDDLATDIHAAGREAAVLAGDVRLKDYAQALAAEFGPQGVCVNAVMPGTVGTDMYWSKNNTAE
jgi:hypothetical protein